MTNIYCILDKADKRLNEYAEFAKQVGGTVIDFYTMDMDELTIIAKHRVLPVPTVLVTSGNRTLLRIIRPGDLQEVAELINTLVPIEE